MCRIRDLEALITTVLLIVSKETVLTSSSERNSSKIKHSHNENSHSINLPGLYNRDNRMANLCFIFVSENANIYIKQQLCRSVGIKLSLKYMQLQNCSR